MTTAVAVVVLVAAMAVVTAMAVIMFAAASAAHVEILLADHSDIENLAREIKRNAC